MEKKCIFCNRANFEDRIISEDENHFVIVSRGQITDGGYLLLIPKHHASSFSDLSFTDLRNLSPICAKIVEVLKNAYAMEDVLMFEHGKVAQSVPHAHLHFLPANCDLTESIAKDFPKNEIEAINPAYLWPFLSNKRGLSYLLWWVPQAKEWRICFVLPPPSVLPLSEWRQPPPPQYLRLVTAELLGRPERGDWKAWQISDGALDESLRRETIEKLKDYFQKPPTV